MSWHWDDDESLAAALAEALADAALLERITSAGGRAFTTHRAMLALRDELDTDLLLLDLVHDSLHDEPLVAVRDRSGQPPRTLVFEGHGVGVELELTETAVEGQLIPAQPGRVTLRTPEGDLASATTDEVGYFRLEVRPAGPVQLVCEAAAGGCVTEWLHW
jgi:hypothetical protein